MGAKWGTAGESEQPYQQEFCGFLDRAIGAECDPIRNFKHLRRILWSKKEA